MKDKTTIEIIKELFENNFIGVDYTVQKIGIDESTTYKIINLKGYPGFYKVFYDMGFPQVVEVIPKEKITIVWEPKENAKISSGSVQT